MGTAKRVLVIDFGNSIRKLGFFEGDNLNNTISVEEIDWSTEIGDALVDKYRPDKIIFSTTSDLDERDRDWVKANRAVEVSGSLNFPFTIRYTTPYTLGSDRLAAVSAVFALYSGKSVLVIDAGTCITYDFVTGSGEYLGGNITPGIHMRLKAMNHFTDQLPLVDYTEEVGLLGHNTQTAIQSGGIRMAVLEAEGLIRELRSEFGDFIIVVSGGDHKIFARYLKSEIFVHPDLVLFGLNEISKHNE